LHSLLRQYGGWPSYWAEDLAQEIAAIESALTGENYALPIDL
jgi:hypothetical protein